MTDTITTQVTVITGKKGSTLELRVLDTTWEGTRSPHVFSDIGRGLLTCGHDLLVFDISALKFVDSAIFGALTNIVNRARELSVAVEFRMSRDAAKTARLACLDKIVKISIAG